MKMVKRLLVFIILMVLALLVVPVCNIDCKDEAERVEFVNCTFEEIDEPEIKLGYTIGELNEIYKDEPALGNLVKALYGFNESSKVKEVALGIVRGIVSDFLEQGYTLDPEAAEKGEIKFIDPPEPNEPEKSLTIEKLVEHPLSTDLGACELCIPTWPAYIELEKDLIVDISSRVRDPADQTWTFVKGTKIYFRDN